jgi:hypothetical protein
MRKTSEKEIKIEKNQKIPWKSQKFPWKFNKKPHSKRKYPAKRGQKWRVMRCSSAPTVRATVDQNEDGEGILWGSSF